MNLSIQNLSKSFDKKTKVLEDLNLEIESGSLTTLLGLSGCGKTTLLRIIAGLERSDTGKITFGDRVVFDQKMKVDVEPFMRNVAFVFQDFALWPNMTVLENVRYAYCNRRKKGMKDYLKKHKEYRKESEEKALEALRLVKMDTFANRMPDELSGGQKQRVAIARAIVISPDVILFDEPLSALDALLREEMRQEIRSLVKKLKTTSIFVPHDQEEAMSISDSIIVMNQGKIIEKGSPEQIYWNPKSTFVASFIGKASFLDDHHFLRPEDISLSQEGECKVNIQILQSQYLGGRYHIVGKDEIDRLFYFYSEKEIPLSSTMTISYSSSLVRKVH